MVMFWLGYVEMDFIRLSVGHGETLWRDQG
jgi:hypothetical protein